jgi:hypothetical protein
MQRLYSYFKENQYPDRAAKASLAEELGITFEQVIQMGNCFIHSKIYSYGLKIREHSFTLFLPRSCLMQVNKWFVNARWSFNHSSSTGTSKAESASGKGSCDGQVRDSESKNRKSNKQKTNTPKSRR